MRVLRFGVRMRGELRFVAAMLTAALAACAGDAQFGDPPSAPVEPEAVGAVTTAYADCLTREAQRIDDGKLSPIGLALKIIPPCDKQFLALEAVASGGNDRLGRHAIRENLEQGKEEFATRIVLRERLDHALPP